MWTMERGEGHCVGNGLDGGHCDGNSVDRGRVDAVDDDRATKMQTDNCNRETTITHSIGCCNGTRTGNHYHKMGHGLLASARD